MTENRIISPLPEDLAFAGTPYEAAEYLAELRAFNAKAEALRAARRKAVEAIETARAAMLDGADGPHLKRIREALDRALTLDGEELRLTITRAALMDKHEAATIAALDAWQAVHDERTAAVRAEAAKLGYTDEVIQEAMVRRDPQLAEITASKPSKFDYDTLKGFRQMHRARIEFLRERIARTLPTAGTFAQDE